MCSVLGGWEQVLTEASAGNPEHLEHLEWVTRHQWRWGKQEWISKAGGRAGGVDLGTDLPDNTRALLMYVSPSIDLVGRFHSLRMPADTLSEERER